MIALKLYMFSDTEIMKPKIQQESVMSAPNKNQSFYDLYINGIGFLDRIRMVTPKNGNPFMAVTVGLQDGEVVEGDYSKVSTTYLDCRVAGSRAFNILNDHVLQEDVDQANTVIRAVVKTGGLDAEMFTYEQGSKQGQNGVSLKSRLLQVTHLYIAGNAVDLSGYQDTDAGTGDGR